MQFKRPFWAWELEMPVICIVVNVLPTLVNSKIDRKGHPDNLTCFGRLARFIVTGAMGSTS